MWNGAWRIVYCVLYLGFYWIEYNLISLHTNRRNKRKCNAWPTCPINLIVNSLWEVKFFFSSHFSSLSFLIIHSSSLFFSYFSLSYFTYNIMFYIRTPLFFFCIQHQELSQGLTTPWSIWEHFILSFFYTLTTQVNK